jgi:hypothetical protein
MSQRSAATSEFFCCAIRHVADAQRKNSPPDALVLRLLHPLIAFTSTNNKIKEKKYLDNINSGLITLCVMTI